MALRRAPTPVTATQLALEPTGALFEPLTAGILGDAATDTDGFPDHFTAAMQHLADDGSVGDTLDEHLAAADFKAGAIAASTYGPIALDLKAFVDAGDQKITGLEGDLQVAGTAPGGTPPAPAPPAPPATTPQVPSGGGGYLYTPADGDPLGLGHKTG